MANNLEQTTVQQITKFILDALPMIGGIVAVWKTIDEIAKWYSRKQEAQLKALIQSEVMPQIHLLTDAINSLREEIGRLKK